MLAPGPGGRSVVRLLVLHTPAGGAVAWTDAAAVLPAGLVPPQTAALLYDAGVSALTLERPEGTAPDRLDVAGPLDDPWTGALPQGLAGAPLTLELIDLTDPAEGGRRRARVFTGTLARLERVVGGVALTGFGVRAALAASPARRLLRTCDAVLGDARCAVPAGHPALAQGCDGALATCRDRFANAARFGGFAHLPDIETLARAGFAP
jgi:hypothetical protein